MSTPPSQPLYPAQPSPGYGNVSGHPPTAGSPSSVGPASGPLPPGSPAAPVSGSPLVGGHGGPPTATQPWQPRTAPSAAPAGPGLRSSSVLALAALAVAVVAV